MNHSFSPNISDQTICRVCKKDQISHTDKAICEACGNSNVCDILYGNFLMCKSCQEKEKIAQANLVATADKRVEEMNARVLIEHNKKIEQSINIVSDIFNAKMVSIIDLKNSIDGDASIPLDEKLFTLAKTIDERYTHLREVLLNLKSQQADNENEQRAIQTYYNELAKRLKEDERAQLKLKDVNYKPAEVKPKKQSAPKTKSLDKIQLHKFAADIEKEFPTQKGLALTMLQTVMVSSRAQTVEAAYNIYKGMLTNKAS